MAAVSRIWSATRAVKKVTPRGTVPRKASEGTRTGTVGL